MHCIDVWVLNRFTQCIWVPPLTEVLCYSSLNAITSLKCSKEQIFTQDCHMCVSTVTLKMMKRNDLAVTFSVWPVLCCSPPPQYWGGRPHPPDNLPNLPVSVPLTAHPQAGVWRQHRIVIAQDYICIDESGVYLTKLKRILSSYLPY